MKTFQRVWFTLCNPKAKNKVTIPVNCYSPQIMHPSITDTQRKNEKKKKTFGINKMTK